MSSVSVKDLANIDANELKKFLNSFDEVLCDCDGVLYMLYVPIQGAAEAIKKLKSLNKNVRFVSNNCTLTLNSFRNKLTKIGLDVEEDDIVFPTTAIITHLKSLNFDKMVYVVGTSAMKTEFVEAGLKLADDGPNYVEENPEALLKTVKDDKEIGAVVVDWDINMNFIKLQKALTYLLRPDVLFIIGATDKKMPIGLNYSLIGPYYFQKGIEEISERKPFIYGKPSLDLHNYIVKKFNIKDIKRTLFIGDSLEQDMVFASKSGYQKLLVLTGTTKLDDLKTASKEKLPDYYIKSLGDLIDLIKTKYDN